VKTKADLNGFRVPTPYLASGIDFTGLSGHMGLSTQYVSELQPRLTDVSGGVLCYPYFLDTNTWLKRLPANPAVSQNLINHAVIAALLKLRDQKVNLALSLAEFDKTASLIAERSRSLLLSYRALRSGQLTKAWQLIGLHPGNAGKSVAKTVLEVQYGWRPLMQDISGAYDQLRKPLQNAGILVNVLSEAKDTSKDFSNDRVDVADSNGRGYAFRKVDTSIFSVARVSLYYRVKNESLKLASAVGLTNPLTIAWELIPYSFVIDWFLPLGNFLDALDATQGTDFVSGTLTSFVKGSRLVVGTPGPVRSSGIGANAFTGTVTGIVSSYETVFNMNRKVYSDSPVPLPYIKNPFSSQHVLNATALVRGRFK